jgi:hypothetical protein
VNSLIVPVYRKEANLERLLAELVKLAARMKGAFEVLFVVDGPDRLSELEILREHLPVLKFQSQLLSLSRNFGSFSAIAGMQHVSTAYFNRSHRMFCCAGRGA